MAARRLLLLAACAALGLRRSGCAAPRQPTVAQAALDAHYLQRKLAHDVPLPLATWHGTHNSFNVDNRTGLFFERPHNQLYGLDAQLRYLGVRYVELDVHYIPEIEGDDAARAKICHGNEEGDGLGEMIVAACNGTGAMGVALSWDFCHAAGLYDYGGRTGCSREAPTLTQSLAEIRAWLAQPGNAEQLIYIYFEDHISGITSDRPGVLQTLVDASLGELVFTTEDLRLFRAAQPSAGSGSWPSPAQLLALGKRVVIFNDADNRNGVTWSCDGCRPPLQFPMKEEWGRPGLEGFDGQSCAGYGNDRSAKTLALQSRGDLSARTFYRVQGDATGYVNPLTGETLMGRAPEPVQLTSSIATEVMSCAMWPQFDLIDEERAAATRWAWADDASLRQAAGAAGGARCAVVLGGDDPRWRVVSCHSAVGRRCACRRGDPGEGTYPASWVFAQPHDCADGLCDDGDGLDCRVACPLHDGVFAAPRTPAEMAALRRTIAAVGMPSIAEATVAETVWLNAVERCPGCWALNPDQHTDDKGTEAERLHCLPPTNLATAPRQNCTRPVASAAPEPAGLSSSDFVTFAALGAAVALVVGCAYRRSVYLAQNQVHMLQSSLPL